MKYFWDAEKKTKNKIFSKEKKLIFLDFDGTLVSIASTPDAVNLDPEIKKILRNLSGTGHARLVILSGRPLKELSAYLKMKNIILAGNHGLEIKGGGISLPARAKQARRLRHFIGLVSQKFKIAFNYYSGVWIEDKKFTLSIHFRNLPVREEATFRTLIRFFKQKYRRYPIIWTQGKKVVEIRPSIYWGKGETVMYLLKKDRGALPMAIGDDQTDEDMFRVLKKIRNSVTIHVGRSKSSLAGYYLNSTKEVKEFLKKLCF